MLVLIGHDLQSINSVGLAPICCIAAQQCQENLKMHHELRSK
jgi:hypothetical protein